MELTQKHKEAIKQICDGTPHYRVAASIGLDVATLQTWLLDDDFKRALYDEQQRQVAELVPLAIGSLRGVLEDVGASNNAKLQAVKQVIELSSLKNRVDSNSTLRLEIEYVEPSHEI